MLDPIHLSALVASRICHDLISPIGAIGNGVELMMMDISGTSGPEMALIMESTANATARIRFFRVAFGQSGPEQRLNRNEALEVLGNGALGGRIALQWDSPTDLARRDVKMVFLALLCLESALFQGGEVQVALTQEGWHLGAKTNRLRHEPPLWEGLAGTDPSAFDDIAAGQVHFALLALEALRQHRRIHVALNATDGTVNLRF